MIGNTALQFTVSRFVSVCALSAAISSSCHAIYRLSTYGRRTFSVAGLMPWNSTYKSLNSERTLSDNIWRRSYFHCTSAFSALEVVSFYENALYKSTFDFDFDILFQSYGTCSPATRFFSALALFLFVFFHTVFPVLFSRSRLSWSLACLRCPHPYHWGRLNIVLLVCV